MVSKYKPIAYTNIPETMEVAQRLAFSHGYKWARPTLADPCSVHILTARTSLVFDPNNKEIGTVFSFQIPNNVVKTTAWQQLNTALKNPELDVTTVDAGDGIHDASVFEDSITFRSKTSRLVGTVTVPKSFIKKVLGWTADNLPAARFYYNGVSRLVQVTKMDDDYIKGFEIEKDDNLVIRTFKVYSMDRVEGNIGISFQQS